MKEIKIDRKLLGECSRRVLLKAVMDSGVVRENLTFQKQVEFCKEITKFSDAAAICLAVGGTAEITKENLTEAEGKIKKGIKYGAAATLGGYGVRKVASAAKLAKPGRFKAAAIAVLALYLFRKLSDQCVRACLSKHKLNLSAGKVCKFDCKIKAINKVIADLKSRKSKCKNTPNPASCEKKINSEISKWSKQLQSNIVKLSKAKEKMVKP